MVTAKPPCDGTCTQESLYNHLMMVYVLKRHYKASYFIVHALNDYYKDPW